MLSPEDIDALTEAVAKKQIRFESPVLDTDEAMALVGKKSSGAFLSWAKRWGAYQRKKGQWYRHVLNASMEREARSFYSGEGTPKASS